MRTKVLLCAALVAAGAISAVAQQNVYSLNIVGYVNVPVPNAYSIMANPLSTGANAANEIMTPIDGSFYLTWVNGAYKYTGYDTGYGGWVDNNNVATTAPILAPGTGFFFYNPGAATTLTFVGQVVPSPGVTNSLSLANGYNLVGSPMPIGGTPSATPTMGVPVAPNALNMPVIDGMFMLTWANGGYVYRGYDSGYGGWVDNNNVTAAPPTLSVGQGFFYYNPGTAAPWLQALSQQ